MKRLEVSGAVRHIYITLGGKGLHVNPHQNEPVIWPAKSLMSLLLLLHIEVKHSTYCCTYSSVPRRTATSIVRDRVLRVQLTV
jgi:hypothetical protein